MKKYLPPWQLLVALVGIVLLFDAEWWQTVLVALLLNFLWPDESRENLEKVENLRPSRKGGSDAP
jgi:hypothetical protein